MKLLSRKSIVVPFDFSDYSVAALDTALEIADEDSKIHVVHVLPELHVADPGVVWQTIDNDNRAKHATQEMRKRLAETKYKDVIFQVEFGDAGHRIKEFAERVNCELIVMSSHGRTGIKRMLIGSVAERVVRLSHCPVLVLRS